MNDMREICQREHDIYLIIKQSLNKRYICIYESSFEQLCGTNPCGNNLF